MCAATGPRSLHLLRTLFVLTPVLLFGCTSIPVDDRPAAANVWTWRGERRIAELIEIPAGVTLRLEPGTVLRFAFVDRDGDGIGDAGLHVLGRIEAIGAPGAPVVLTSAEPRRTRRGEQGRPR